MIPDQATRDEALDARRSFIVQAPAGSGKTGLLVQRYLRLLSTVEKPESVVAITFTRKAAGEMHERIHAALEDAARSGEAPDEYTLRTRSLALKALDQDRRLGWELLRDTSRLHLETIDSLCALLARQMPAVSGFAGAIEVIEDATELYRLAAVQTLRMLAEGPEESRALLMRLGSYFESDFNTITAQIVRMLAQRDQWQFDPETMRGEAFDFWLLIEAARAALEYTFKERHAVDFTAITEAAIRVLGSQEQPSDVLYGLDYRIQHLLIDEFQDTSLVQYKLVNALTSQWSDGDGHTLFLVGDPMQSIYRFRGAEVSLFLKTWKEERLQAVRLYPLSLEVNFRSTPQILQWIDKQFQSMPVNAEDDVPFRPVRAARTDEGSIPEWRASLADSDCQQQATAVAEIAGAARTRGSVAILVRSRSHLTEILPVLRQAQVEYEAVEIDQLGTRQHILDMLSLTRAVLHVADRTAWLACLRAPWCGLTVTDFALFAENERRRPIVELLNDSVKLAALSPDVRGAAVRTGEILSAAVSQAGRVALAKLIEDTWLLLGGPAVLRESYELEDVKTFLQLLNSLDEGGAINDFTLLIARLDMLFAKGSPGENSVQIMTIFKAKGLEFDTVILPRLDGSTKSGDRDLLVWDEVVDTNGTGVLKVAAQPQRGGKDPAYTEIQAARRAKDDQELKRLLYVACTRAKNALYLLGNSKIKKKDKALELPKTGSFLRLLWPNAEAEFQISLRRSSRQLGFDFSVETPISSAPPPTTILHRLPSAWRLPRFSRWINWQPPFRETTPSTQRVTYEWVSDTGRHVGTVVHEILKLAANSDVRWDAQRVSTLEPTIRSELLRLGVSRSEERSATERVVRSVRNTLTSQRGQWILAPHQDARSEWPLGGKLGDQLISGTVDRMFRDDDGRVWIIDFKTSEHEGGRIEQFLDEEQRRYRSQLESYAALLSRLSDDPIWLALYFPLLDAWRAWPYPERVVLAAT